ncbi:hypothetical protein GCM10023085_38940 [Actinomadura viridis]
MGAGGSVESDDGVEVDDAAPLVFGDFGEGDGEGVAELAEGEAGGFGDASSQGHGEASPQLRREGVEEDGAGVVVAVGAQWLPEAPVLRRVPDGARHRPAVRAGARVAPGVAGRHRPAGLLPSGVDGAEGGCGEGDERGRV